MSTKIDLHNHTYLCNHVDGSPKEYIKQAIEEKIDIFGFSDHAPMNFDQKYRMSIKQTSLYEQTILDLKEKYASKIEILLGYEVDFLPGYMLDEILNKKCDYLIGSVHFIDEWGFDNPEFIGHYKEQNIDEIWEKYFNAITNMAKSRLFDIVGHLDLIKVFKFFPNKEINVLAHESLLAIKEANMVVEINSAGFRKPIGEQYPSIELIKNLFELDIPITFGSDAHSVSQVGQKLDDVINIAKKIGYKQATIFKNRKPELIKI